MNPGRLQLTFKLLRERKEKCVCVCIFVSGSQVLDLPYTPEDKGGNLWKMGAQEKGRKLGEGGGKWYKKKQTDGEPEVVLLMVRT